MSITNCNSLVELSARFESHITLLKNKIVLRDAIGDRECDKMLKDVERTMSELDVLLMLMKAEIKKQKQAHHDVITMKKDVAELHKRVIHASENIPPHLPKNQLQVETKTNKAIPTKIPVTPKNGRRMREAYTPLLGTVNGAADYSVLSPGVPSVTQIKRKAPTLFLPTLEYLTVAEFESVPKYQRGRLTYEQINSAVDEFNSALTAKYKLLATARPRQNDRIRKVIFDYKEQENKDTKGIYFITEKDLKSSGKFKLDSAGRAILTILRHCTRIREVRSKGLVRLAAVM